MSIWGKIIGGAAGFAFGGPLGALVGAAAGHAIDSYAESDDEPRDEEAGTKKVAFTIGVIALGAKMAKVDGVVTKDEIAAFREVFHVPQSEIKNVGRVWDMARKTSEGYEAYAQQIARLFNPGSPILEQLVGNLFYIAKADGMVHESELAYLKRVSEIFGFDALTFDRFRTIFMGNGTEDPYTLLGVDPNASNDELKTAYRTLLREHHPDRLMAQGLPEEFVKSATEKMATINAAWDRIKKSRGIS